MSLPRVFAAGSQAVPGRNGYLVADPVLAADWWAASAGWPQGRAGMGGEPQSLRMILAGRCRPRRSRSCWLCPALCSFPCNSARVRPRPGCLTCPHRLSDYAATAALIANLDLVVTVDTSAAHLAGALGVPCWVMLPFAPDWRWRLGRDDSVWYGGMRLFRQPAPGAWHDVVTDVA